MSIYKRYDPHNQMLISFLIGLFLENGQTCKRYNIWKRYYFYLRYNI